MIQAIMIFAVMTCFQGIDDCYDRDFICTYDSAYNHDVFGHKLGNYCDILIGVGNYIDALEGENGFLRGKVRVLKRRLYKRRKDDDLQRGFGFRMYEQELPYEPFLDAVPYEY